MNDLDDARAVTERLFSTAVDPDVLAERNRQRHAQRNEDGVAHWRAWLAQNLDETLALDDGELERRHDFIQWLFPLGSRSPVNPSAPVIGRHAMLSAVQEDPALRDALLRSWARMLAFYGLVEREAGIVWVDARRSWAVAVTHNDRRVSRMLHCLHSAGLHEQASGLMAFLEREFGNDPKRAESLAWWRHQVAS